jgi:hypothetical protein
MRCYGKSNRTSMDICASACVYPLISLFHGTVVEAIKNSKFIF